MSIQITEDDNGTKRLTINKLKKVSKRLTPELRAELDQVWDNVLMDAIGECPILSGALASTIRIVEGAFGGMMGGVVGRMVFDRSITAGDETILNPRGVPTSHYASSVHDGYTHPRSGNWIAGYPFLEIALDRNMADLERAINRVLKSLGEKFGD